MTHSPSFDYDVFVSCAQADRAWVRGELLKRLDAAGLHVCVDWRDFRPGAPRLKELERAVKSSRKTLVVLTPAHLASEWAEFGDSMVQTLDPASRDLRFIPLLREKCELPLRIRHLTYVNMADPEDEDIAWRQLLTALGAPPIQEPPEPPKREEWCLKHPYPMPPNFTGRADERRLLTRWLNDDGDHPLLVLRALGGFGKSALCWHWLLNDVDPAQFPRVVWWSFYEGDASFDSFLRETLEYLLRATHLPGASLVALGPRQQADELLRLLHQPGTLLVLDGFERALRAYSSMNAAYQGDDPLLSPNPFPLPKLALSEAEGSGEGRGAARSAAGMGEGQTDCVSPIAEDFLRSIATLPGIQGRALMTTRLRPRAVEARGGDLLLGCREEELTQMQPADAVAFFRAQGIRGSRAEIEAACAPYGYHPLSLRLLAGLIANDLGQPGDIAAARRLDVAGDLVARQHHVLEHAYTSLTPDRRKLLSRIACFRSPVSYEALCAVAAASPLSPQRTGGTEEGCDAALRDLIARGLLHHDRATNRYDLHPIVRRYAYDRLTAPDRAAAHAHLRDYFAAVPTQDKVQSLDDLQPVIELYHHTVRAGQYDEAFTLFRDRLTMTLYFQFGAYQLVIELLRALFPDGEGKPPRLKDESAQGWTLNTLACAYSLSGQPRRAVPLFEQVNAICEKSGDKKNLAIGLGNVAQMAQLHIGALRAAEANLRRYIALSRELGIEEENADAHSELGRLLAYRGAWAESEQELAASTRYWKQTSDYDGLCIDGCYRSLLALLMHDSSIALRSAQEALAAWNEDAKRAYPTEGTLIRTEWLLGAAHRVNGASTVPASPGRSGHPSAGSGFDEADRHLSEALTRCRSINMVDLEAYILLDLARLRAAQGHRDEALRLAQEALLITERSEYVLQGADVHLFLAQMALETGDRRAALGHAKQARRLATCDGPPDYTYKVAYEEAGALLAKLE